MPRSAQPGKIEWVLLAKPTFTDNLVNVKCKLIWANKLLAANVYLTSSASERGPYKILLDTVITIVNDNNALDHEHGM